LGEALMARGYAVETLHGDLSQAQRDRVMRRFRSGQADMLIATEVAARGLDIEQLPHVVNYELPMVPSDYVHRIGRTGRAGLEGTAISLVCVDELPLLREIARLLGQPIPSETVPGFAPDRTIRAEPIRLRTGGAAVGRGGRRHAARTTTRPPIGGYAERTPRWQRKNGRSVGAAQRGSWQRLPGERSAR
jgi:ATP-dependent RNA helicase RhlE